MRLSPFFDTDEFECNDGTDLPAELVPVVQRLVTDVLDPIRTKWGQPLIVVSGYRTPEWNRRVGGAAASTHLTGEGADIAPTRRLMVPDLHELILGMVMRGQLPALGGLGEYRGWVHVDTRRPPDRHLRRWRGKGVGSEP